MNYYMEVLRKYAVFTGRARRSEYWYFALINIIIAIVVDVIDAMLHTTIIALLYTLAIFLPALGVVVRRLHDIGRSGWWYLLVFIPIVGWIILIVWFATDSQPGMNQYGPNPKGM